MNKYCLNYLHIVMALLDSLTNVTWETEFQSNNNEINIALTNNT